MTASKRRAFILTVLALASVLYGCADEEGNLIVPPILGSIIDRMGRSGVNTAVTDPFFADATTHGFRLNEYNSASNPDQWVTLFADRFAANLAIYDSLDTVCGNQLLAGPTATAGRYATLASVLADDRIWVNTASGACGVYLAVEANATGLIPNADCGGRTPLHDTIDVTYSAFAIGAVAGVTDGVPADADSVASLDVFPFLRDPN